MDIKIDASKVLNATGEIIPRTEFHFLCYLSFSITTAEASR